MLREYVDLSKNMPFKEIVVRDEGSGQFLLKRGYTGKVVCFGGELLPPVFGGFTRDGAREGLGYSESDHVMGIYYEPQFEWAFRRLTKVFRGDRQALIYVNGKNARRILTSTNPNFIHQTNVQITDDSRLMAASDELVCFRYIEEVSRTSGIPVKIMDVNFRFLTKEMLGQ